MSKFVKKSDEDIKHIWKCPDSDCEEKEEDRVAEISPDWYERNGTPMCCCDSDMTYVETLVREN